MSRTTVTGVAAMQGKLRRIAQRFPTEAGRALFFEMEVEATECKRRTPVDTGALINSIHTQPPQQRGKTVSVSIVAGGPAAPYALTVHEDLEAFHPKGEAKFIEGPLMESAPYMGQRIARRIELNKLV